MMNLIALLVTSFLVTGTEAHFRPCSIGYTDGSVESYNCYPEGMFTCEHVNLTIPGNEAPTGSPNTAVDSNKRTINGLYLCKPRPCVDPASVAENQTVVPCSNASANSECVDAEDALDEEDMLTLQHEACGGTTIDPGHFENLSTDPDIHYRCSISSQVILAQLACKVMSNGTMVSQRACVAGSRTCNSKAQCEVTINGQSVKLHFCD